MALTICIECKGTVSDQAQTCPHCGISLAQKHAPAVATGGQEDKRRHRRFNIKTMVKVNGKTAMLFNISRGGMMLSSPFSAQEQNIEITMDNGEKTFVLNGVVRWINRVPSFSNLIDFGVEITAAPSAYYEFIDHLESCL